MQFKEVKWGIQGSYIFFRAVGGIVEVERDSIVNGHYNYSKDVVQTLGMARYDNLVNDAKKEILFIPTWRRKINTKDQLKNSHYFKFLNSFLNNKELRDKGVIEFTERGIYKKISDE